MGERRALHIMIGGEAGQGLQTVGEILARSFVRKGYSVLVSQTYESRVRGGHNTFSIRAGIDKVRAPSEGIDILVALTGETVSLHQRDISPDGLVVLDQSHGIEGERVLQVPFDKLAERRFSNVAAIAIAGALAGLDQPALARGVSEVFRGKDNEIEEKNRSALRRGFSWIEGMEDRFEKLARAPKPLGRIMLSGNEAIALGAIAGGMKFCAFYPMSPSTSIALTLAQWSAKMGLIVEQVEDEIAAINMAIGASFAGAPALVPTSGGGFALMVEGISLAAVSETPVVVAVAQRPGPATGLATRTEQADLEFVLHAGHGEFPRAIFAPGTIEECFHLTRKALEVAERFQGPVFILTDHFLADCLVDVDPFPVEEISPVNPAEEARLVCPGGRSYNRYEITASGVSPRLLPGMGEDLVVGDSHEHTEDGHMTEDLSIRPPMVDKRLRKADGIRSEAVSPAFSGTENPEILFISWGSTRGAVEEAAESLRDQGKAVSTLHFSQVWPMVPEHFLERMERAGRAVCVEGNATGQLARLIRRETGFEVGARISRYDGLPITPEYILREGARQGLY